MTGRVDVHLLLPTGHRDRVVHVHSHPRFIRIQTIYFDLIVDFTIVIVEIAYIIVLGKQKGQHVFSQLLFVQFTWAYWILRFKVWFERGYVDAVGILWYKTTLSQVMLRASGNEIESSFISCEKKRYTWMIYQR